MYPDPTGLPFDDDLLDDDRRPDAEEVAAAVEAISVS